MATDGCHYLLLFRDTLGMPAEGSSPSSAEAVPKHKGGKQKRRISLLAVILIAAMAIVYFSPLKSWLHDSGKIKQALDSLGMWKYPICGLAVTILVACGTPRLLFCPLGGMVFGFWKGLLLTQGASLLGYYLIFLFVRWGGRNLVMHRWPKLQRWADMIQDHGVVGVILIRQIPLPGTVTNLCLGLSRLRHRHFLLGTIIGLFPEAVPLTLIGAGLVKASVGDSVSYIAIAVVLFALLWIGGVYIVRRMRTSGEGTAMMKEVSILEGEGD